MNRCNCRAPTTATAYRLKEEIVNFSKKTSLSSTVIETLYLKTVYHVIYNNSSENISLSRIQSQHEVINKDFSMTNQDNSKVPSIEPYNFIGVKGNSNIQFLPLNHTQLQEGVDIMRVYTSRTSFSGVADVSSNGGSSVVNGAINIYICSLGGFLGEAFIQGNRCAVLNSCVGGPENLVLSEIII